MCEFQRKRALHKQEVLYLLQQVRVLQACVNGTMWHLQFKIHTARSEGQVAFNLTINHLRSTSLFTLIKKNWNPNMSFTCIGDIDCTFADLGMEYLMRKVVDVGKFDRFMAVIYRE